VALPEGGSRFPFVGRGRELDELEAALDAVRSGKGALCLIGGEPGVGKTRLAWELSRRATSAGVRVLWSRCHAVEGRPPYWPWLQVLQAQAREETAQVVARELGRGAYPLARLVPELRDHLPEGPSLAPQGPDATDTARFLLFQGMADFLRRMVAFEPCLLVLDDIHDADLPSLLLLDFLAHDLAEIPLLVAATFREAAGPGEPFFEALLGRIRRRALSLALHGLDLEDTARFIAAAAGEPAPDAVAERLHRETDGNPFFLDELVRLLRGRGTWSAPESDDLPIPPGVRGAIEQHLAPLGPDTRELLGTAAVVGRQFDLPLLEAATGTSRPALLAQLAPALELEILATVPGRPGEYRFSHSLVREVIYDDLPPDLRADLHRRYGELLERRSVVLDGGLAEIAHHFFHASASGGEEKAIEWAERAGLEALRSLAYEDAAEQLGRALQLTELRPEASPRRACELLVALGEAHHRAGQGDEAVRVLRRAAGLARRLGSSDLLARAATGLSDVGSGWAEFGRTDASLVEILDEAQRQLGADQSALRARVMARLATELLWTAPSSRIDELSAEAVRIARATGDGACLAYALLGRIHCLSGPHQLAERLTLLEEVVTLTRGRGDLAVNALLWKLGDELQMGRMARVDACRDQLIRAVHDTRQPGDLWMIAAVRSQQAMLEGRIGDAEACLPEMGAHPTLRANADHASAALAFLIHRERGGHRDLVTAIRGLIRQYPALTVWRSALAMLHAELGELREARAELDAVLADGPGGLRLDVSWLSSVAFLAEASRACGAAAEAAALYEVLRPYDGRNVVAGPLYYLGPVAYSLGILAATAGRPDAAADHLGAALASAREAGALPFVARISIASADVESAAHGRESPRAAEARREGLEIARELGMSVLVEQAARSSGKATAPPAAPLEEVGAVSARGELAATLRREGDLWTLEFRGRTSRFKDLRGLLYLSRLLGSPGIEVHVLDLVTEGGASGGEAFALGGDLGPVLDATAKAALRSRLEDLREREEEADRNNDRESAARARAEIERLAHELSSAVGLGGRDRRQGGAAERARASVTKAIRAAIRLIERSDAGLAEMLSRTVRTGTFCSYEPLGEMPLVWRVELDRPS
jgi:tetratricopeptide (TPR) repeat protein